MARTLISRAAPCNVNAAQDAAARLALLSRSMALPLPTEAQPKTEVAVGDAVDGSTLGGSIVLDPKTGLPIAAHLGPETPFYAKPLLMLGGNKFPTAVAASTLLGGVFGLLMGGPLWALGGLVGGNLMGRLSAGYVCGQADKADNAGCDQATAWGTSYGSM